MVSLVSVGKEGCSMSKPLNLKFWMEKKILLQTNFVTNIRKKNSNLFYFGAGPGV